jgi:PAS domain S-box-containing protein
MPRFGIALLFAALSIAAEPALAQQKQVLLLIQNPTGVARALLDPAFEATLDGGTDRIDWFLESVDPDRFRAIAYEETLTTYLRDKYAGDPIDLVIAAGAAPLAFLSRHGASLFPGAPIIFGGIRESTLRREDLPAGTTGVLGYFDVVETIDLALALQPDARQLVLVAGVAPLDVQWSALARERVEAYRDRLDLSFLFGEPFPALLERLAALPRSAIVILLSMVEDGAGVRFNAPADLIGRISAASNAPVYGVYDVYVGEGAVGGYMDGIEAMAAAVGQLALRVLDGESAAELPIQRARPRSVVDWRQLDRWDLDESRLPPGTVVEYRDPSLWDRYRAQILGVTALIALQTLLIVVLLLRVRKRRVERALHASEDRYRNVVDSQSDLICRFLPDGTLTFVNEAYCRYFGRAQRDLVGSSFLDLLPEVERAGAMAFVQSLAAAPRTEERSHRVLLPDGSVGWQHWIDHAIVGADGRVSELQGVGRDITALKLAETEALERREQVTHLTRVAILGELSGALAHELNQPLTAILSNARAAQLLLARDRVDLKELQEILKDIVADDKRAGEVIRRLRELLRRGKAEFQPLDVNRLVGEVLSLARGQLVANQVAVTAQLEADVPASRGDRVQLLQVLLNLVINGCEAMEATEPAERTLAVATAATDGIVRVTVADNGTGLAPRVAERLFEPFVTTKDKGLGLGLSICRSIIVAHGGQLSGTNNPGRGATFELRLPVYKSVSASSNVSASAVTN